MAIIEDNSWNKVFENYTNYANIYNNTRVSLYHILNNIDNMRINIPNVEIYPKQDNILNAFKFCDYNNVKVVIIGQDPYHGYNQATGLAFGINNGNLPPPSLMNISRELKNDLNIDMYDYTLESWARQGVLLLNSALTVFANQPGSQLALWKKFTEYIISCINALDNIIFVAWGSHAYNKLKEINTVKNHVIVSSHPSPLSCYKPFQNYPPFNGSRPFSHINNILSNIGKDPIIW